VPLPVATVRVDEGDLVRCGLAPRREGPRRGFPVFPSALRVLEGGVKAQGTAEGCRCELQVREEIGRGRSLVEAIEDAAPVGELPPVPSILLEPRDCRGAELSGAAAELIAVAAIPSFVTCIGSSGTPRAVDEKTIGARIRELRKRQGMTQGELAAEPRRRTAPLPRRAARLHPVQLLLQAVEGRVADLVVGPHLREGHSRCDDGATRGA
jgi:hypothetical protein